MHQTNHWPCQRKKNTLLKFVSIQAEQIMYLGVVTAELSAGHLTSIAPVHFVLHLAVIHH